MSERRFTNRTAAILVTAGTAIGLGNIWRFPYMMGMFGGAAFLLLYVIVLVAFGIPGLMVEWALGRETGRGPVGAFRAVGLPGAGFFGGLLLVTVTMAASYYGLVVSWVLYFVADSLGIGYETGDAPFTALTSSLPVQFLFLLVTVTAAAGALASGLKKGIERLSRLALPLFFGLFLVLIGRTLTLPGAWEGVEFYLLPRWEQFSPSTLFAAIGQAYFSLALGGTFMLVYGSYLSPTEDLTTTAVWTALADASAAILAGLAVVPAVVALGIDLQSGPPLMFVVMPEVFHRIPLGSLFGVAFFGSVFLVALLSLIAAYEVVAAALESRLGWSRPRSAVVLVAAQTVLAIPAMLSSDYLLYSDLIWGSTMQPVGSLLALVAFTWCLDRGQALAELRRNARLPVPNWLFYWIRYGIPATLIATLVSVLV